MDTKARINLKEGIIELEGSEEFVSKYLDYFENKILTFNTKAPAEKKDNPGGITKQNGATTKNKGGAKKKKIPKKINLEEFEFEEDSNGIPSLKDFLKSKKVSSKSTSNFVVCVGYYITKIRELVEFTEGNIEYAYKVLGSTNRPAHLHQIIINRKNDKHWFEDGSNSEKWKLSRLGEIFVENNLPEKEENK